MHNRRTALRILSLALVVLAGMGWRAEAAAQSLDSESSEARKETFTAERFAELQQQGALVLLDVFASWCPTCAQQQRILDEYRASNPDAPLHTLTIDFDDQKQYVRRFGAPRQSTLILYRGTERIWFSVAETRADVIVGELDKAVMAQRP
jgi:thioredoxin 1